MSSSEDTQSTADMAIILAESPLTWLIILLLILVCFTYVMIVLFCKLQQLSSDHSRMIAELTNNQTSLSHPNPFPPPQTTPSVIDKMMNHNYDNTKYEHLFLKNYFALFAMMISFV